jgi:hypothetical protein
MKAGRQVTIGGQSFASAGALHLMFETFDEGLT